MKKNLSIIMIMSLVVCLLAGCSSGAEAAPAELSSTSSAAESAEESKPAEVVEPEPAEAEPEESNESKIDVSAYVETSEDGSKSLTAEGKALFRENILKDLSREYLHANNFTISDFNFPEEGWNIDSFTRWDVLVTIKESDEVPEVAEFLSLEPISRIIAESAFLTASSLGIEDSYQIIEECIDELFFLDEPNPFEGVDVDLESAPTYEEWEVEDGRVDAGREAIRRLYNGV